MVVLKNQNRRSGIFYLRPLCGFGFFSKSDFSAIFFSHFRSSTDSFLKFSLSRLQINAKYACSVSLSWLTISPAVSSISFSGLSSGTLKKSSLCVSRRARAIPFMFHLLKVINLLIEYLGILSSANALAGRSTPLSAGSGAQACPDGQIHRPFGWFGVAGMPWRADQRLFGRFGGAGMP